MSIHKKNLRKTYNRSAQDREASNMQDWKIKERATFLALLQERQKNSLLELGAGVGRDSAFFKEFDFRVTCIDLSPAMVALCKEKGLDAHEMDMVNLDFPDASFDAIYAMNSLLHLAKTEFPIVLAHINSLLRPEGWVYLGLYGGFDFEGVWEEDHQQPKRFFSFFSDEHIKIEVAKVFDIRSFKHINVDRKSDLHFQSLILEKRSP